MCVPSESYVKRWWHLECNCMTHSLWDVYVRQCDRPFASMYVQVSFASCNLCCGLLTPFESSYCLSAFILVTALVCLLHQIVFGNQGEGKSHAKKKIRDFRKGGSRAMPHFLPTFMKVGGKFRGLPTFRALRVLPHPAPGLPCHAVFGHDVCGMPSVCHGFLSCLSLCV